MTPIAFIVCLPILQRRVEAKSEAVVPATQEGVAGTQFEDAEAVGFGAFRNRGRCAQMGGRHVPDQIVVVDIVDTRREMELKRGENVRRGLAEVSLRLVLETREVALQAERTAGCESGVLRESEQDIKTYRGPALWR